MDVVPSPDTLSFWKFEQIPTAKVQDDSLAMFTMPRLSGEKIGHVCPLVETADSLPPIIVYRPVMRILDGMHRVHAPQLRGEREIKATATRIMLLYRYWLDRMVDSVSGLLHNTACSIRERSTRQNNQSKNRVGWDERIRPHNAIEQRVLAGRLLTENPNASLREVARAVAEEQVRNRAIITAPGALGEKNHLSGSDSWARRWPTLTRSWSSIAARGSRLTLHWQRAVSAALVQYLAARGQGQLLIGTVSEYFMCRAVAMMHARL